MRQKLRFIFLIAVGALNYPLIYWYNQKTWWLYLPTLWWYLMLVWVVLILWSSHVLQTPPKNTQKT